MSIAISARAAGKHSPANAELRARRAEADNRELIAAVEDRERDLHTALVRGCQDAMLIAQLRAENKALKARVKELGDKVIRAGAEHQRLRQAVINARPRIREVDTQLVRPYSPVIQLPYVPPVDYPAT